MISVSRAIPHICALSRAVRKKRLLLMATGFFDESGRTQIDSHLILAGWTASIPEWEAFTEEWNECLHSRPSIEYFKFSEAAQLDGQFKQFSRASADAKKIALAELINCHPLRGYVTATNRNLLVGKPTQLKKMMFARPYDWSFMLLVMSVLGDRCDKGEIAERIDLVFDKCSELKRCIESYEKQRMSLPFLFRQIAGTAMPGDDRELSGLQAADFLAGELCSFTRTSETSQFYRAMLKGKPIVQLATNDAPKKLRDKLEEARNVLSVHEFLTDIFKLLKKEGVNLRNPNSSDFVKFNAAMSQILRADPAKVKAEVDAEIQEHTVERKAKGERKRGRKPGRNVANDPSTQKID
jgi:hypothetical protein